jgi:hypothetical protein
MSPGDRIFFWRSGPEAAIIATATITSSAYDRPGTEFGARAVNVRYEASVEPPLRREEILLDERLSPVRVFTRAQGTNFALTSEQADSVDRLLNGRLKGIDHDSWPSPSEALPAALHAEVLGVPIEEQHLQSYSVNPPPEATEAERAEATLVLRFSEYLRNRGVVATRNRIRPKGEEAAMFTDVYVAGWNLLVEAKGSAERSAFRMAIGQLADYRRFLNEPKCAILLPTQPKEDLLGLAAAEGMEVYWPEGETYNGIEHFL